MGLSTLSQMRGSAPPQEGEGVWVLGPSLNTLLINRNFVEGTVFYIRRHIIQFHYNPFHFCHPRMFEGLYLYEKTLLLHTIWVGYALGPKVYKKKFWWSYDTPNAKSVTFCESTYVFWGRPVAGHSFQIGCLRKNKSSSDRRIKDINRKSAL